MPNTNGHGPKRVILYARVSADEQARSGYSLTQQREEISGPPVGVTGTYALPVREEDEVAHDSAEERHSLPLLSLSPERDPRLYLQAEVSQGRESRGHNLGFRLRMLKHPGRIRAGMDRLIAQERDGRHSDPEREAAVWAEKAAECARLRGAYQDQQAAGLMTLAELGSKLEELESTRQMAEAEIAALAAQEERVEELERDRDALIEFYAGAVPEALDQLDGEERNRIYRMLRLEITPQEDGSLDVRGILSDSLSAPQDNDSATDDFVLTERHLPLS